MATVSILAASREFERAMVFVDGTNLFHRLRASKLCLEREGLFRIGQLAIGGRETVRTYVYTSPPEFEKAKQEHEAGFDFGVRLSFGEAIPTGDGNHKEKGVDALLVADFGYHAATRNLNFAVIVSVDTDFVHALRRVEDFGCRTAVVAVCATPPKRLTDAADEALTVAQDRLIAGGIAKIVSK
jgi:uncharacterized LabA/DUF88 family protein